MKKSTKMMLKAIPEGTWFAVPLRTHGYAAGVVARTSGTGLIIGYLFGTVYDHPPSLDEVKQLRPQDAIDVHQFGDLGLTTGKWPIIGNHDHWKREEWPLPDFVRREEITRKAWRVRYSDEDPSVMVSETPVDYDVNLASDSLSGAGAVERWLTHVLSPHTIPEGTWFAVPLERGGFTVGLVTRVSGTGFMTGYFFSDVHDTPPSLDEVKHLQPEAAAHILRFGDYGLITGKWPILGKDDNWHRDAWPNAEYLRRDVLRKKGWRIRYSDLDPTVVESETPTDYATQGLDWDGLESSDTIEMLLSKETDNKRSPKRTKRKA